MNLQETRKCNLYNLQDVADYYKIEFKILNNYYNELLEDQKFLNGINQKMKDVIRKSNFTKAIFSKKSVDSIDWFAFQRVLLYVLIRALKLNVCLETGVYYGGNTAFILNALFKNRKGILYSIDLPDSKIRKRTNKKQPEAINIRHPWVEDSELYREELSPGFIIPEYLHKHWKFIEGDSLTVIPDIKESFDFYIHDSDHSFDFLTKELSIAKKKMTAEATIVVDDINWSNAFYKFCAEGHFYPLCLTDNGKDNLSVRTGLIYLNHSFNKISKITGA